jgi:hypothetical protein
LGPFGLFKSISCPFVRHVDEPWRGGKSGIYTLKIYTLPCRRDEHTLARHVLVDLEVPRGRIGSWNYFFVKTSNNIFGHMDKDVPTAN